MTDLDIKRAWFSEAQETQKSLNSQWRKGGIEIYDKPSMSREAKAKRDIDACIEVLKEKRDEIKNLQLKEIVEFLKVRRYIAKQALLLTRTPYKRKYDKVNLGIRTKQSGSPCTYPQTP